jgi:hypothetical protein
MVGKRKGRRIMIHELKQLTTKEVMTMIEGSVKAIVDNPDYFYSSGVGPQYSKLTPSGCDMILKTMTALLPLLAQAKERELNERAKSITWNTLQEEDIQ